MGKSCADCHGGDDAKNSRAYAHSGTSNFQASPVSSSCITCHANLVNNAANGLHTTLAGFTAILSQRGFGSANQAVAAARFDNQCTKCHTASINVATSALETSCGFCHVSVPQTAGGGLLAGHDFQRTPSMGNNCTACHGSRVKDEYYGQNNALLGRNKAAYDAGSPWIETSFSFTADTHKLAGLTCVNCHINDEMHGSGTPLDNDRYAVTTAPLCLDCHGAGKADATAFGMISLHTEGHLAAMDCQICHTQPYKNCFGCHTDVTGSGLGFYRINEGDPTLAARQAAAGGASVTPDALMTFRAGVNPKWTGPTDTINKKYSVLRHVPVDKDVFTYTGDNALTGLIPNMGNIPTWKHATPHNIQRVTKITRSCNNCHGTDYDKYWLTDPIANAQGWLPSAYQDDETDANAGRVTQPAPFAMGTP